MSIQSEIDRLAAAKAGLAAAIGTKGVVVPDGATLSEYPALVEKIQGGGDPWYEDPPEDGLTRIYIRVLGQNVDVGLSVQQSGSKAMTIDWGDGSPPDNPINWGDSNAVQHTYSEAGKYVITISVNADKVVRLGSKYGSLTLIGTRDETERLFLERVYVGDRCEGILNNCCYDCHRLNWFDFRSAPVPEIQMRAFLGCSGLLTIDIPETVQVIGSSAFEDCISLAYIHLRPVDPPSLSATNAFSGIPADCIIYVPAGSLEAYQTATNWSAYADQMQEEPS